MLISGVKVATPTRAQLKSRIAKHLEIRPSRDDVSFLRRIIESMTGAAPDSSDVYQLAESALSACGLVYDPHWDTNESNPFGEDPHTQDRFFARILSTLETRPRCFILAVADNKEGSEWETDHESQYRYSSRVSGRVPINQAGPGSRVIYYATSNNSQSPRTLLACATVAYIRSGGTAQSGPWTLDLIDYLNFSRPVPIVDLEMPGWNQQVPITEISWGTYMRILEAGGVSMASSPARPEGDDPSVAAVHKRTVREHPATDVRPTISLPNSLPTGTLTPRDVSFGDTEIGVEIDRTAGHRKLRARTREQRRHDKEAEKRAVELTIQALTDSGWTFVKDRQADGIGYDLDFAKSGRDLHVEVKGIQGDRLAFNVTRKEFDRAINDDVFVVVAVTNVLSPVRPQMNFVTRDRVVAAQREVLGYRVFL